MTTKLARETLAPKLTGGHVRWFTPHGLAYLCIRSGYRYFVTGHPLRGEPRDNATFLRDATEDIRPHANGERLTRARWRRVSRRWVILGIPWLILDLWAISAVIRVFDATPAAWARVPWLSVLIAYIGFAFVAVVVVCGHMVAAWLPVRAVRNEYVYPAGRTLAKVTARKFRRREAIEAVQLPPNFGSALAENEKPEPVRIFPHPDVVLDEKTRLRIANEVGARLGMEDCAASWTVAGVERAFVELQPAGLPPAKLTLADVIDEMRASPFHRPVIGVANGGKVIHSDSKSDSPHTLGSAPTGAGKSTLYKSFAMQRLAHGSYAILLDFKKWSHLRWAGRLPAGRVLIADEIPDIHDILVRVGDELIWRKSFELHQEKELEKLPALDVYLEELGSLRDLLNDHWEAEVQRMKMEARRAVREAKAAMEGMSRDEVPDHLHAALEEAENALAAAMGLPKKSPATQALKFGVNLGREFNIFFHFISQSIDANVAGGRNVRASFRTRFLARWDAKDWKMLAPGVPFVRCPSGEPGLWAHVHGSEVEVVRVPWVEDTEAVQYVLDGIRPALPMFHGDPVPALDAEPVRPEVAPLSEILALLPAKRDGSRMTLDALRTASKRAPQTGFPAPVDRPYTANEARDYPVADVLAWFTDREGGTRQIGG